MTGEIIALVSVAFTLITAAVTVAFSLGRHAERIRNLEVRTAALEALQRVPAIEAQVAQLIENDRKFISDITELKENVAGLRGENVGRFSRPDPEEIG